MTTDFDKFEEKVKDAMKKNKNMKIGILQEKWNVIILMTNFFHLILEKTCELAERFLTSRNVPIHSLYIRYPNQSRPSILAEIEEDFGRPINKPFSIEGVEFGLLSPFRFFSGILFFFFISSGYFLLTEEFTSFFTHLLKFCIFSNSSFQFFFQLYLHSQEKNIDEEQYVGEWMRLYGLHNQVQKSRQIKKNKWEKFLDLKYTKFILGFSSIALLKNVIIG